jgi:chromosome segregation ATPase
MASKGLKMLENIIRKEVEAYLRENKIKYKKKQMNELESAADAADEEKAAKLQQEKAKLDQQIAGIQQKKAGLQKQIDAIEKK